MLALIEIVDEGFTDVDKRKYDIFKVKADDAPVGSAETKRWLVVKTENPGGDMSEYEQPEFGIGGGDMSVIRRQRKYMLNYSLKLSTEEIAAAEDPAVDVPIVEGVFTLRDIVRK